MQGEGLTNEGRHHLLLLCKQAHDKRGIAESLHCQWAWACFRETTVWYGVSGKL